jgi:hypothetical protein
MPADDGGRRDDHQFVLPAGPTSGQPDPEQPIPRPQPGPPNRSPQDRQLPARQVLGRQRPPAQESPRSPKQIMRKAFMLGIVAATRCHSHVSQRSGVSRAAGRQASGVFLISVGRTACDACDCRSRKGGTRRLNRSPGCEADPAANCKGKRVSSAPLTTAQDLGNAGVKPARHGCPFCYACH